NGFYHVRASHHRKGFVWGKNIEIQGGPAPTPTPTPVPSPTPSPTPGPSPSGTPTPTPTPGDLFSRLMAARKPAVGQPLVLNGVQICGPEGDTGDPAVQVLNDNKNRTDIPAPSDYVDIGWDDLKDLPSDRVTDFQGASVVVTGFLSHRVQ